MTTLAFLGDLHLDPRSPRYAHALDVLDDAIDCAREEHQVSVFVTLGDTCEGALSGGVLYQLGRRFEAMARYDTPTVAILGNHETPDALSPLWLIPGVTVADSLVQVKAFPDVVVACLPYPRRGRPPYARDESTSIADSMQQGAESIAAEIRFARALADRAKLPLIVAGHFTIEGMTTGPTDYELHPAHEVIVPRAVAEIADLTVVGHIHSPQEVGVRIVGAGSLYRTSFGEARDPQPRSWVLVHVDRGRVTWERVPTVARRMEEHRATWDEWRTRDVVALGAALTIDARMSSAECKIIVEVPEDHAATYDPLYFDPIRERASLFVLERRIIPRQRVRAPEVTRTMGLAEQIERWLDATGDVAVAARWAEEHEAWARLTAKAEKLEGGEAIT